MFRHSRPFEQEHGYTPYQILAHLRFNGNLYVLIDGRTGSTAVDFAGTVKYNKLGTLVGQETGDTMASYGDALSFKLPNSQMTGIVACRYFEMPGTTKDNATQGVKPDHYVAPLLEDTWDNSDRVMKFVQELCSCD